MAVDRPPLVSIILVNYNGGTVVLECLRSLEAHLTALPYEVIVVDNASQDDSPELIATHFPQIRLIRQSENRGFGAGNNTGARSARGEFLLLLNTDTYLTSDLLPVLVEFMEKHPAVGIVGPRLLNADGSLQLSTAWAISLAGEAKTRQRLQAYTQPEQHPHIAHQFDHPHAVDVVVGAALFLRKSLFTVLNGFDEQFFMYFEESDLCQRAQYLGWKIMYLPDVAVVHYGGYSVQKVSHRMAIEYRRSQLYYYQKHRPLWEQVGLRLYLLLKFSMGLVRSRQSLYFTFITLMLDLKQFPLKRASLPAGLR